MTTHTVYSNSRLNTFEKCPLQYKYHYIDEIKNDIVGIEAFMGSRVHETLEYLHQTISEYNRIPELEELIDRYEQFWTKRYHPLVRKVKQHITIEDYIAQGKICINDFYNRQTPFDQDQTIALEKKVHATTRYGHRIRGFVDRLAKERDTIIVEDYKTSSWLPKQQEVDKDRQLGIYQLCIQQEMPDTKRIELRWHYLKHNKTLISHRTPEQIAQLENDIGTRIEEIEHTKQYPPTPSQLCPWCQYTEMCPARSQQLKR